MNLDAIIIVLREVLEAAVLASLLLALAERLALGRTWFWWSLAVGGTAAWFYAGAIGWISELWDYSGQEMLNAAMQIAIFAAFCFLLLSLRYPQNQRFQLSAAMFTIVGLALVREVSEILLYLQSYAAHETDVLPTMLGSVVGVITGLSVGVMLFFVTLWAVDWQRAQTIILCMLSVVVAGILMQAVSLLMQVDRLPQSALLWDTGVLIDESSTLGQLLYALIGYEATPTLWHVSVYAGGLLCMLLLLRASRRTTL